VIVEGYGHANEREIVSHGPGRFLGELNLITGEPVYLTAVVRPPLGAARHRRRAQDRRVSPFPRDPSAARVPRPQSPALRGGPAGLAASVYGASNGLSPLALESVAVHVGRDDGPQPYLLETSRPGVFAAGDARSGSIKRVASAVGEGSMAVRLVHDHLASAR
jgi:hypothetical protein